MLIQEKLQSNTFSPTEKVIIDYLLKEQLNIKKMTTKQIAEATYTSPSLLIRIAHKLGYSGFNEFKEALILEEEYELRHASDIDANIPFKKDDSLITIAQKIATLEKDAIQDTCDLINPKNLQIAVDYLRHANQINVFGVSNNLLIAQLFQHRMRRIRKNVIVNPLHGETQYEANAMPKGSCAIILSYSGETPILVNAALRIKEKGIPLILISNIGESSLSHLADVTLAICTREKLYSKIATYSTDTSFEYILDLLYSCVFAMHYEQNFAYKQESGSTIELGRKNASTSILKEE